MGNFTMLKSGDISEFAEHWCQGFEKKDEKLASGCLVESISVDK